MTGRRIETFEYQGRRYRLFDGARFVPANDENAAQFTCSASEVGGELEEFEIEGESAECVAQQLGLFTIDGDAFFLLGCAGAHVRADGTQTFEADVTGPDGEEHLVLVGENATSALRQLGAA